MSNHGYLKASQVRNFCGNVSDMTLWRWLKDEKLGFPKPTYITNRRYWREVEIQEWWDARSRAQLAA